MQDILSEIGVSTTDDSLRKQINGVLQSEFINWEVSGTPSAEYDDEMQKWYEACANRLDLFAVVNNCKLNDGTPLTEARAYFKNSTCAGMVYEVFQQYILQPAVQVLVDTSILV